MISDKIHIGCSSFTNDSWKTIFYPNEYPKKKWFDYYCLHFNTYEFNGSFYRFPTVTNLVSWYNKAPANFKFSIKIPKEITHINKLENCEKSIAHFYKVITEGLSDKLGCVLWQFPPSFEFSEERLNLLISSLNPDFKNVIEVRHKSWWQEFIFNQLAKHSIIFCNTDYPNLPTDIIKNSSVTYLRLHGNPKLFYSEYTASEIEHFYKELSAKEFKEIYIYFNNTASSAGIINALQMITTFKNK